jgi:hypothetical protein
MGVQSSIQVPCHSRRERDPPLSALSAVHSGAPFSPTANSRLEQLEHRDPKEVRDSVEIVNLPIALTGEKLADPHLTVSAPLREIGLRIPPFLQERRNIFGEESGGLHGCA